MLHPGRRFALLLLPGLVQAATRSGSAPSCSTTTPRITPAAASWSHTAWLSILRTAGLKAEE
ncbi:hypothetical protein BJF90_44495 [Pseudonocardia sp. CNS-004]|nr:hypothetical protein BJF90_44495 [Pseudonocardia sp. CNS-004]